eukprot:537251-Rhodomonas_salina.1
MAYVLSAYARAMRCPVLTSHMVRCSVLTSRMVRCPVLMSHTTMSGTDVAYSAMSSTDFAYSAMSGTNGVCATVFQAPMAAQGCHRQVHSLINELINGNVTQSQYILYQTCVCYAASSSDLRHMHTYGAVSGIDLGSMQCSVRDLSANTEFVYAPMRCPALRSAMCLCDVRYAPMRCPLCAYAMSGTET